MGADCICEIIVIGGVVIAAMTVTLVSSWFLSFSDLKRKRFLKILDRKQDDSDS